MTPNEEREMLEDIKSRLDARIEIHKNAYEEMLGREPENDFAGLFQAFQADVYFELKKIRGDKIESN